MIHVQIGNSRQTPMDKSVIDLGILHDTYHEIFCFFEDFMHHGYRTQG